MKIVERGGYLFMFNKINYVVLNKVTLRRISNYDYER